jgi:hypothetical protein
MYLLRSIVTQQAAYHTLEVLRVFHAPAPLPPCWQASSHATLALLAVTTIWCVRWKEGIMAEYGEWNRKGATLSDVTAKAEYSVSRDFIVNGIQTGKLEYREGAIWGNPYLRVLRSQLEQYIAEALGEDYLRRVKNQTELRRVKKEIAEIKKKLAGLQERQKELEVSLGT